MRTLLEAYASADVLSPGDIATADRLAAICKEPEPLAQLALAFALRAVRNGSTCFDPADLPRIDHPDLPSPQVLRQSVSQSRLQPVLAVEHGLIYLDRYRELEISLCDDLRARANATGAVFSTEQLAADLARLFPTAASAEQSAAIGRAAHLGTCVLTGGPGTGKTTTVAGLLAVLRNQAAAAGDRPLRVALAAPTGKAAARMRQALLATTTRLDFTENERSWLQELAASTLHRLLGFRPDNRTRFRHDRTRHLPYDVVVVDEASMASLELVARLLEAMRPEAKLVLVGDADQLASVEAGAVLHDVVAGWSESNVITLTKSHRFGDRIGQLAAAVRDGDGDGAIALLSEPGSELTLIGAKNAEQVIADRALPSARALIAAATNEDSAAAFAALNEHRILCAHRSGPAGASTWNRNLINWLRADTDGQFWFVGKPVLLTQNDAQLGVYNGDAGVTFAGRNGPVIALEGAPQSVIAPARLPQAQAGYAMTIHRSQGSEFNDVTIVLPTVESAVMSRELLYTAITRAIESVTIIGSEQQVRAAIGRQVARSSGIAERLRSN